MRALALLCLLAALAPGEESLAVLRRRMRQAKDRVFPAMVYIVNVEEGFAGGRTQKSVSSGSGFLVDARGHIVTNYHVAGQGKVLVVTLASRHKLEAKLVAGDPYTDIAVLRVDPKLAFPDGKPAFAKFGDSDKLQEGDFVMAMGSPLSLARSVSFGIISCRNRTLGTMRVAGHETGKYNNWLQTDAAINPGNSGGPLVNLEGEVVGVNTLANLAADNIGFAIPSNVVRDVVAALLEHRRVPRSYLGLTLQPTEALENTALAAPREGVLVAAVAAGSPAQAAGIRPGDFVTRLNGAAFAARFVQELPGLYQRISRLPAGESMRLTVRRGGRVLEVTARPEALGRHLGRETQVEAWGITVRAITERMKLDLGLADRVGVMVTGVRAGGPASGRLERNDIIRTVQGNEVRSLAGFLRLAQESARREDDIVRLVFRRGTILDVTVLRPKEKE
ncbi:MAG: trypsin-like peptidase domain-containing protein [Planctomycetota bacterium]